MANKLFQQMTQNNSNNIIQMYKTMSNPNVLLNSLANNNPQVQSILNMIKQSGKSPKDLFYEKANEMGVNPNSILSLLK